MLSDVRMTRTQLRPAEWCRTARIPRAPQQAGTHTAVGLGPVGVMVNGVAFFDPRDAQSYNNQGIWHQNANVFESNSFDGGPWAPSQGLAPSVFHHISSQGSLRSERENP